MELYFSPLACSMATRIVLYEAGASATFVRVDLKEKRTERGEDFRTINALGCVPTLRTDDGEILTENAAILQYVAGKYAGTLAPAEGLEQVRLQQWLSFVGTELHMGVFSPLLDTKAPEAVKRYALEKSTSRLAVIEDHLKERNQLLDEFSVADAYLVAVLGWTTATPIKLSDWKELTAYVRRLRQRPSIARAIAEELPLYGKPLAVIPGG